MILMSNVLIPYLSKISQNDTDGRLNYFNYTTEMYHGMEIMLSVANGCEKCQDLESEFKKVASERGFIVSNVLNVTEGKHLNYQSTFNLFQFSAAYDLFQRDFHQYSMFLALGLEFTSDAITIQYNTHATHILPVAVNLINNALLHKTEYRISSSSNFSLVTNLVNQIYFLIF